jgi:hypothetical protein
MTTMAEITVDISRNLQDGTLRIRWSKGSRAHRPYFVKQPLIELHAQNVRNALQNLVDAGYDGRTGEYGELTAALARQGFNLYDALFFGATKPDQVQAKIVKDWVTTRLRPGEDRITFSVTSKIHIPWGLIYDQPVEGDEGDSAPDPRVFEHFWCQKFEAATQYFDIPPLGTDVAWRADDFAILFGADEQVWNSALEALPGAMQAILRNLIGHPEQPKFKLQELVAEWGRRNRAGKPHGFLSFFCHAAGAALCVGGETVPAPLFEQRFSRDDASDVVPPTLVFLAGCQTAIGDLETGFIEATGGPGYCGFIGTEAKVPDVFTLKFLAYFLKRFYAGGRDVSQVMHELRGEHWPISLVFALCCSRDLELKAGDAANVDGIAARNVNLSWEQLSSD